MQYLNTIQEQLKSRLSEHRFRHTESVAKTALLFAQALRNNPDYKAELTDAYLHKIELAAWLHDCCKELKGTELLSLAEFYGIEIFKEDQLHPNILHARVGASWIEEEHEIYDPTVLLAVRDHTLGSPDMLTSSKILYLADMLEPTRNHCNELEQIRKLLTENYELNKALLKAMNFKIQEVIKENKAIHPLSIVARNAYLIHS